MRIPKYQAWHKTVKRMFTVASLSLAPSDQYVILKEKRYGQYLPCEMSEVELREFTGLRNKRGVEVYESDILQITSGRKMQVVWHGTAFCWDVVALSSEGAAVSFAQLRYTPFEIIGNRFQHPELLEEGQRSAV